MDYEFYNVLGQSVDLKVYIYGSYSPEHRTWTTESFKKKTINYQVEQLGTGPINIFQQLNLKPYIKIVKDKPDIVISIAFWFPSLITGIFKNILNYKFMIVTDAIANTDEKISIFKKYIRLKILKKTDAVLSGSSLTTKYIKGIYPSIDTYLSLLTIDITKWTKIIQSLPDKTELRRELKIDSRINVILGVGAFTEKKNWLPVIEQMKSIPNSKLILIGSGNKKFSYLRYIEENKLENKVLIIENLERNELVKYYKLSDIFIFPSLYDRYGYVVIEALSSGLPVLCANNVGSSTLIRDDYNGYLIDPIANFVDVIELGLKNKTHLSKNCYNSISHLSFENKVIEYLEVFKNVSK